MRSRNTVTLERDSANAFQVFCVYGRTDVRDRPTLSLLFSNGGAGSPRVIAFPIRSVACATCSSTAPSPLSFLLVCPARGKRERRFFHPARNAIRFLERKRSICLGRYRSCSEAKKTRWIRYVLFINAYDGWSFFLGKNRGSKGRTRCRDVPISYWTRRYSCIVRECVVIYRRGRMLDTGCSLTWKCSMMVHIKPRVNFGFPSTMSSARILTSLIFL